MVRLLENLNAFIWSVPALLLSLGVGVYLSLHTGFVQMKWLPKAFRMFGEKLKGSKGNTDGVSAYQALCTALAATVGTGNLAGVAGAIAIGGPGAVFWMWICALLGMVTKFAEATLAVRYRVYDQNVQPIGGPMYMIENGMGKSWRWLGILYCLFGVVASLGVGNAVQINTVIGGIKSVIEILGGQASRQIELCIGISLAILVGCVLRGGARRIGAIAEQLVPVASLFYLLLGAGVLLLKADMILPAFGLILRGAFSPGAITGGVIGSAFQALRVGASRGVFTNEAGMGTASIAHASAQVSHPIEQGFMGIMEVFLDTIVICTMTALVILCSGIPIHYGRDDGVLLTMQAFSAIYGNWISVPITIALCSFAIATVFGWGFYGTRCAQYIFGEQIWKIFATLQAITVVLGAVLKTGTVWLLSEIVNGLMSIPNLIALVFLSPELVRMVKEYGSICTNKLTIPYTACKIRKNEKAMRKPRKARQL